MKLARALAAVCVAAAVAGCDSEAPPPGATRVSFTVLTQHSGFPAFAPVLAARTFTDLVRQRFGSADRAPRPCPQRGGPMCLAQPAIPPGSLVVALAPMPCAANRLDPVYLQNRGLHFVMALSDTCPPGGRAVAVPEAWLVAVPLASLPRTRLPLEIDYVSNGKPTAPTGSGLVDLRPAGPGHATEGNVAIDAVPPVVRPGQADTITLTILGIDALRDAYPGWLVDFAASTPDARVVWHQVAYDGPASFECLRSVRYPCVGAYHVVMPTAGLPPGRYEIRPSFVSIVAITPNLEPPLPPVALPPIVLPVVQVEVRA